MIDFQASMLLISRLTEDNDHYLHQALEDKSRGIFAKSVVKFRDHRHIVLPAMAIFSNLTREFSERTLLLEKASTVPLSQPYLTP